MSRAIDEATKAAIRGPADRLAVEQGCWFDEAAADRACEFFRRFLRLPPTKGQQTEAAEAGLPPPPPQPFEPMMWQAERVLRPLFGWKRRDGSRRFRKGYVSVAKKNGKTGLAAGSYSISLVLMSGLSPPAAS